MGKRLGLIICCFILSGCATTPRSADPEIESMQSRIDVLEDELKTKNQDIVSIQNELEEVKNKQARSKISVKKESNQTASKTKANNDEMGEIIRVSGVKASQVQLALKNAGFYKGKLDGKIGPNTKKAIKAFQQNNDLKVDGIVGRGTWSKLKKSL